jgi:hypothetical protein
MPVDGRKCCAEEQQKFGKVSKTLATSFELSGFGRLGIAWSYSESRVGFVY